MGPSHAFSIRQKKKMLRVAFVNSGALHFKNVTKVLTWGKIKPSFFLDGFWWKIFSIRNHTQLHISLPLRVLPYRPWQTNRMLDVVRFSCSYLVWFACSQVCEIMQTVLLKRFLQTWLQDPLYWCWAEFRVKSQVSAPQSDTDNPTGWCLYIEDHTVRRPTSKLYSQNHG